MSVLLVIAARFLFPILLMFSVWAFLRGHHEPGGGFIGGLFAATAFVFMALADGVDSARKRLNVSPRSLIAVGLLIALSSGLIGLWKTGAFLGGVWMVLPLGFLGEFHLGTPLLFDFGVFLTVIGVVLAMIFTLSED